MKKWLWIKWHLVYKHSPVQWATDQPTNNAFGKQNVARIEAILNRMADEKSKQVYTSIIEHRRSFYNKGMSFDIYEPSQYFIKEVTFGKDEVFIDCGAFNGDTIYDFIYHCPNYKHIVAFEPGTENFEQLKAEHENNPKITLINAGVGNKEETLYFTGVGASGTILAGGGGACSHQVYR